MRARILICLVAVGACCAADDTFLIRGAAVHPVTAPEIANGCVLVKGGKIAEVGAKIAPPKGVRIVEAKGLHVYPGMIDSGTMLGLTEVPAVTETNDSNDLGTFKPQLRAAAAVNPASEHFAVNRANGLTAALTQPAGGVICGQAALLHLDGWTVEDMAVRASVAMRLDFPAVGAATRGTRGQTASFAEAKRRYEQQVRELDEFFEETRRYQRAKAAARADFRVDLKLESMLPVLDGKLPVLLRADREKSIRDAMDFAARQKIRMILQSGRYAWKLAAELKAKNVPVALGPTLALPAEEDDPYDRVFTTPVELYRAGVKFCFSTFGPGAGTHPRNLPYEAAAAVPFGLPAEEALKAVTIYPAQIFGVADVIGSIEPGKWADLIITDGDPLETRTQVKQMFIQGRAVDLDNRHKRLYEKYLARP